MNRRKVAVVGGGQMGRALVGGMLASSVLGTSDVQIVEPCPTSRAWWKDNHPDINTSDDLAKMVGESDTVIFAVKPNILPKVAQRTDDLWAGRLMISIAAGVSLTSLMDWCGHDRVVRVMPNTPSLVGEGASAFCAGEKVTADDKESVQTMLSSVGLAVEVNEYQMDAVTGLSGSGPAYMFVIIEAMADGGVLAGLPRPLALQLAAQTVLGAAKMVMDTGQHPGALKDSVASPGGTTIAALNVLEQHGVRGALMEAVKAAADRSEELTQ